MKLFYYILFFLLLNSISYSQDINLDKVNKVDNNGLKQGLWVKYKIDTTISHWVSILTDENGVDSGIDTIITSRIYNTGYYSDNKKDSVWNYYNTVKKCQWTKQHYGSLKYEVRYKEDSICKLKEYYSNGNIKLEMELKNNKADGKVIFYYTTGIKKYETIISPDIKFSDGTEYAINGRKLRDRKFNSEFILKEWLNYDNLINRINE